MNLFELIFFYAELVAEHGRVYALEQLKDVCESDHIIDEIVACVNDDGAIVNAFNDALIGASRGTSVKELIEDNGTDLIEFGDPPYIKFF